MKRLMILAAALLLFASCSLHRANVAVTPVYSPSVETTTMASLDVSAKKINYVYYPEIKDSKSLSQDQLIKNAVYAALQSNGGGDELVGLSYYITVRRGFFGKKVRSIAVSGYPATYTNFREPTEADKEAVETLSRSKMYRQSKLDKLSLGTE